MALQCESSQADSEPFLEKKEANNEKPRTLGLRFTTAYEEQTGLLHASDMGLEFFSSSPGQEYYTRSDAKPKPDDESGWEGQQSSEVWFGERTDVGSLRSGTLVHVLFHFHDNYCDAASGFLDLDEAKLALQSNEDKTWDKIQLFRQHNADLHFCLVKHDKWHCDLLYCEKSGRPYGRYINRTGGWERPDKGDTWWLRSIVID